MKKKLVGFVGTLMCLVILFAFGCGENTALDDAKKAKIDSVTAIVLTLKEEDYDTSDWSQLNGFITEAVKSINAFTTVEEVEAFDVSAVKTKVEAVLTKAEKNEAALATAKTEAKATLATYKSADDYREAEKTLLANAITAGNTAIDAATTKEAVATALANAKTAIDGIKTDAQYKAEEAAALTAAKTAEIDKLDAELAKYAQANYRSEQWTAIQNAYNTAKAGINAVTDKANLPGNFVNTFKTTADAQKTAAVLDGEELTAAKTAEMDKLDAEFAKYVQANYRSEQWTAIQNAYNTAKAGINAVTDKANLPGNFVSTFKTTADAQKTAAVLDGEELAAAKTEAKATLADYKSADLYREAEKTLLTNAITAGNTAIDAATTKEAVQTALNTAKAEIDKIKTDAQYKAEEAAALAAAKTEAKATLADYKSADLYREAEKTLLTNAITAGYTAIDAATTKEAVQTALANAKTAIDGIKTDAQYTAEELEAAKTAEIAKLDTELAKYSADNYRAEEFAKITEAYNTAKQSINAATAINEISDEFIVTFTTTAESQIKLVFHVSTFEELVSAINAVTFENSKVVLTADISGFDGATYLGNINVIADTKSYNFTLDLNGHNLGSRITIANYDSVNKTYYDYSINLVIDDTSTGTKGSIGNVTNEAAQYGVVVIGNEKINLTVNNVTLNGFYGGIATNGIHEGATISANNATIQGTTDNADCVAAYFPANYTYNFVGCTFNGYTGVYIKSGTTKFDGCTINAYGSYTAPVYNGNGADGTGDALTIQATVGYKKNLNVTVKDSTFTSKRGTYAIEVCKAGPTGAEFNYDATLTLEGTNKLSRGVCLNVYSREELVTAIDNDNFTVVKLGADVAGFDGNNYLGNINVIADTKSYNFTLDLNGHNLGSRFAVSNYNFTTNTYYDFGATVSILDTSAGKSGSIGSTSNATLQYGICVFGNDKVTVNIKDIKASGYYGGLSTNGYCEGAFILASNVVFEGSTTDKDCVGAYLPANYEYNFSGCTFNGYTGVHIKSGSASFFMCKVNAYGEYAEPIYNGNGADGTGNALMIQATKGYHPTLNVTIEMGTFTSAKGYAVEVSTSAKAGETCDYQATVSIDEFATLTGAKGATNGLVAAEKLKITAVQETYTMVNNQQPLFVEALVKGLDADGNEVNSLPSDLEVNATGLEGFNFNLGASTYNGAYRISFYAYAVDFVAGTYKIRLTASSATLGEDKNVSVDVTIIVTEATTEA